MPANFERLRARMDELGLDAVVATTKENVLYLTGISNVTLDVHPHGGQCYVLVTRDRPDRPYVVSPRCDLDQTLDADVEIAGTVGFGDFFREIDPAASLDRDERDLRRVAVDGPHAATALDALVLAASRAGCATGTIAVDEDGVPYGFLDAVTEALPDARVRTGADVLRWTRKVKTPAEIDRLTRAAAITEDAIRAATAIARPGVTEIDLVREFDRTIVAAGARPAFTLIKFGRAAVGGQRLPRDVPLRAGETVWMDVGCVHRGYWSDLARVYSVGEPPDKLVRYHAAMKAGTDRALAEARPGMSGKELFDIVMEAVRAAGVPHYRRQHVGHGIGVEIYDRVLITPTSDDVLEEGTVVNAETPYHELGFGAVQIEDPFVVGRSGNRLLTSLGRDLATIDIPGGEPQ
ncbi:M24 family metallopeptidase [Nonomuraea antimicrobica]|uniref:M24 family metallopeptidase n=1 Tax=Nonomuraea antimicrobica TaxID=561173 RepID=A0ABP7DD02_9ACTN